MCFGERLRDTALPFRPLHEVWCHFPGLRAPLTNFSMVCFLPFRTMTLQINVLQCWIMRSALAGGIQGRKDTAACMQCCGGITSSGVLCNLHCPDRTQLCPGDVATFCVKLADSWDKQGDSPAAHIVGAEDEEDLWWAGSYWKDLIEHVLVAGWLPSVHMEVWVQGWHKPLVSYGIGQERTEVSWVQFRLHDYSHCTKILSWTEPRWKRDLNFRMACVTVPCLSLSHC